MLLVLQWSTLIAVRALPWSPPHDAERLILPSFAFFALLIGQGAGRLLYRESLYAADKICAQRWVIALLAIALGNGLITTIRYQPQWLSYYTPLVGGLRGATALGCEPTYYWDALDQPVLDWLREHTAANEKVFFGAAPTRSLWWLRQWRQIDFAFRPADPGRFRWYVRQRRESGWSDADHWLRDNAQPVYQKLLMGVPLVDIYDYADYQRAQAATAQSTP